MKISALEIRKQEFSKTFRGYEIDEVQSFLQMLANQWHEQVEANDRLEAKIRELEMKMEHYIRVEEALQEALQTARETSRQAIESADRKAAMIVAEAENRAVDILRQAEDERHKVKRETTKISGRRKEIVARLRAFLMSEMELLAHFDGEDPVGFIKLLPSEDQAAGEQRMRQLLRGNTADLFKEERDKGTEVASTDYYSDSAEDDMPEASSDDHEDSPMEPSSDEGNSSMEATGEESSQPDAEAEGAEPDAKAEPSAHVGEEDHASSKASDAAEEDVASPRAHGDEPAETPTFVPRPRWRRKSLVTPLDERSPASDADSGVAASAEEIEKIGRLLDDLDN